MAKKRNLLLVNEHFEPLSNAVLPSAVDFNTLLNVPGFDFHYCMANRNVTASM